MKLLVLKTDAEDECLRLWKTPQIVIMQGPGTKDATKSGLWWGEHEYHGTTRAGCLIWIE